MLFGQVAIINRAYGYQLEDHVSIVDVDAKHLTVGLPSHMQGVLDAARAEGCQFVWFKLDGPMAPPELGIPAPPQRNIDYMNELLAMKAA